MSRHSPEQLFHDEPPPSDADLHAIKKTLWDVVPEEVAGLTATTGPRSTTRAASARGPLLRVYLRLRPLSNDEREAQKSTAPFLKVVYRITFIHALITLCHAWF